MMFKFDRKKFFGGYRDHFGPLNQSLVEALDQLIDEMEKDERFEGAQDARTPRRKLAYCLATFKWETAHTMRPIDEYGSDSYFNKRYGPGTAVGKRLGNNAVRRWCAFSRPGIRSVDGSGQLQARG
jgi:putative chitinase